MKINKTDYFILLGFCMGSYVKKILEFQDNIGGSSPKVALGFQDIAGSNNKHKKLS